MLLRLVSVRSAGAGLADSILELCRLGVGEVNVSGKTRAREVCRKRAQLVGGWKCCVPRGRSGRFRTHRIHTLGGKGVKPAAGALSPLQ